jgi:hypothetical protein
MEEKLLVRNLYDFSHYGRRNLFFYPDIIQQEE